MPRWQHSFQMIYMNEDVRALKDTLENLNTQKSTSSTNLTGILSKNSES